MQKDGIRAAAFRKQLKIAADVCDIKYPVSTHSLRKNFGFWLVKLHPYDVTTVDKLEGIFSHSDRNATLHYIGIVREDKFNGFNGSIISRMIPYCIRFV